MNGSLPWTPTQATERIRAIAKADPIFDWTAHAKEQMAARSLVIRDVLYVLKYGYVHEPAQESDTFSFFKYRMECSTPNTNNRSVRIVVIPRNRELKVITVMWVDEK